MFSYTLLHVLPFSWQKPLRWKMLSLRCSFLDISVCYVPIIFRHLCKWFHLHERRCELKDGFDTVFLLKDWLMGLSLASLPLWNMLPSSLQMMGFVRPFPTPFLTKSYIYGIICTVQYTYWDTLVSSLMNVAVSRHKLGSLNWLMALSFRFHTTISNGFPPHDRCELRDSFCVAFLCS